MFLEEAIHCLEWARDQFCKNFTQFPKNFNRIIDNCKNNIFNKEDFKAIKTCLKWITKLPNNFNDYIKLVKEKYYKVFISNIKRLLLTYPVDKKDIPKRLPKVINNENNYNLSQNENNYNFPQNENNYNFPQNKGNIYSQNNGNIYSSLQNNHQPISDINNEYNPQINIKSNYAFNVKNNENNYQENANNNLIPSSTPLIPLSNSNDDNDVLFYKYFFHSKFLIINNKK